MLRQDSHGCILPEQPDNSRLAHGANDQRSDSFVRRLQLDAKFEQGLDQCGIHWFSFLGVTFRHANTRAPEPSSLCSVPDVPDLDRILAAANPVRLSIIERLVAFGPHTQRQLTTALPQASGSIKYHLRILENAGYIDTLPDGKFAIHRSGVTTETDPGGRSDEGELEAAQAALERLVVQRRLDRVQVWMKEKDHAPADWGSQQVSSDFILRLTPDELRQLGEAVDAAIAPFQEITAARAAGSGELDGVRAVFAMVMAFPLGVADDGS